jgi:hypothetical protein
MVTVVGQEASKWSRRDVDHTKYFNNWSIGLGINAVFNSGTKGKNISVSESLNISNPFALTVEYYTNNKFSFDVMFSVNKFKEGKLMDNTGYILKNYEANYLALDMATKLYVRDWFKTYVFDPYIMVGLGVTSIGNYKATPKDAFSIPEYIEVDANGNMLVPSIWHFNFNTGAGFNVWISNDWGVNAQAKLKWGIKRKDYNLGANSISNHAQFTLGAVYFINR